MPATYAHWNFGGKCIEVMPKDLAQIVRDNREIYDLGVHGPDIFFYDLAHPNITKYGSSLHDIPVSEFFTNSKNQYNTHNEKDAMLAYLIGFLSHVVLDSACHSYVERKIQVTKISHNHIEAQWERHLMELDKRQPNLVDRTESLKPNKENARIISYFYKTDEKVVARTTRNQKLIVKALNCISPIKEKVLKKILCTLNLNNFADLFINFEEDEKCADSNLRLDKLSEKAISTFKKELKVLVDFLNDKGELSKYFDTDLSVKPNYKDIEVLPLEKELTYKV